MTRNDNIHRTNEFYRKEIIKMTKNCDNREFLKGRCEKISVNGLSMIGFEG